MAKDKNSKFHNSPYEETHESLISKEDVCDLCDGTGETLDEDTESGITHECELCSGTGKFKIYN